MADGTVQPQGQDQAHSILAPIEADDKVKADAWEIYYNSEGQDFEKKLGALSLPQETKAALWKAKTSAVSAVKRSSQENTEQPSTLEKTDKAITGALETNPENLKSLARTNLIEVPKTLGREVYSGIKAIGSMPGGIYHAFADEPTQEERERNAQFEKENGEAPGAETSGLKRIGLGIQRMSGIPAAEEAVKTYANPKTRPSYEQILSVAPEALGQGAGTVLAAKAAETAAPKIVRGVKEAAPAIKNAAAPVTDAVNNVVNKGVRRIGYNIGSSELGPVIEKALPTIEKAVNRVGVDTGAQPELIPSRSVRPTAEAKPGYKPIMPAEEPALKPLGTKTAEPVAEEPAEVRQARHVLGNVAVDKLKTVEDGPEALRRLTKGTYQQYADLANAMDIKKPAYLAEKNGDAWQANEFKRTVKEHGKSLSGPKETVVRELLSKPPAEILQHTKPWVDSTAKYPAQMSSLTERTMKALGLTEEAKNNLRASGVSDAQAQSLLAKLTKRQLENLSETMEKGEHLPTVSGGSQSAEFSPNASGESAASQEAINRTASEKAKGTKYYRLDTRSGRAVPLTGPDRVDAAAGDYDEIVKVENDGTETTLDRGNKARPRLRSSKLIQQ